MDKKLLYQILDNQVMIMEALKLIPKGTDPFINDSLDKQIIESKIIL